MPAPNQYVTSINSDQSFLTQGQSQPALPVNPNFSTINLPPNNAAGVFFYPAPYPAPLGQTAALQLGNNATGNLNVLAVTDGANNDDLMAQNFIARGGARLGASAHMTYGANSIVLNPAIGGVNLPVFSWNGIIGANKATNINNISTLQSGVLSDLSGSRFALMTPLLSSLQGTFPTCFA